MKVLFIQPYADESNTNYPPMGMLYLAAYLREFGQHEVRMIDLRVRKEPVSKYLAEIGRWRPDVVGLTGMSIEWTGFQQVAEAVRQELGSAALLVAGGPHASAFTKMVLSRLPIDVVVRGEGEQTLLELLAARQSGAAVDGIPGLAFLRGGELVTTPPREVMDGLDRLPFPAYDLLDIEAYFDNPHFHTNLNKYNRILPLITSRGCPFHCSFCYHSLGYRFRPRSPDNVLREIDWAVRSFGIQEFQLEDDTFNFDLDRAKAILRGVISRGHRLAFSFPNGIRADLIDRELIDLFRAAGVYRIHFGIETIVPRVQRIVSKPLDRITLDRSIAMTDDAGISSHGFFMIGFPTETEEEIRQTIDYAVRSRLATANFSIVKVFPGTPLGDQYLASEQQFEDDFAFSYDSTTTNFSAVPGQALKRLQREAMIRFYFRPGRMWRIFRTSPNKRNLFFRNALSTLSLIVRGKTKY